MAYDQVLGERLRDVFTGVEGVAERKMFGGLAFMVGGHMCCGVVGPDLCARVGKHGHVAALGQPHTRPMDFTGRPMGSMVYIAPEGVEDDAALTAWVERCLAFVRTLPPK